MFHAPSAPPPPPPPPNPPQQASAIIQDTQATARAAAAAAAGKGMDDTITNTGGSAGPGIPNTTGGKSTLGDK
jgi:hypothetical protein